MALTPEELATVVTAETAPAAQHPQHLLAVTRIKELEQMLLVRDPLMKNHLAEIHKLMSSYEELVHLLTEEEIAVFIAGMQSFSQSTLIADAVKKGASKSKAAIAKITVDML